MNIDMRFTAIAILGIYLTVAAIERVPRLQFLKSRFLRPSFLTDVGWYVSTITVTMAFGPVFEGLSRMPRSAGIATFANSTLPLWCLVLVSIVVYDFGAFVSHTILHRVGWLWRLHKVHHSSPVLDWLATTRSHVVEHLVRGIPTQAVLFAIGLPTDAVALALCVYAGFATLGHSNLRLDLRAVERVFITPRLHRLHHVPKSTNKNFATVFSFWDRILGSLILEDASPEQRLGVPGEVRSYPQSWWRQFREPFRSTGARSTEPSSLTVAQPELERGRM